MIQNEREYKVTKSALEKLLSDHNSDSDPNIPEWLATAGESALASQIEDLKAEIEEYETLKTDGSFIWECQNLLELPKFLIKARIARGLSQREMAERLGMKQQQIQRYEANNYKGANLNKLMDVAHALEVNVSGYIESKKTPSPVSIPKLSESSVIWSKFPVKEMTDKGWLNADEDIASSIPFYLHENLGSHFLSAHHKKKFHGINKPNEYSLMAWQARVLEKANSYYKSVGICEFEFSDDWVDDLVKLSTKENSPLSARDFLSNKGIVLVIEKHLDKTYLDGASMLADFGNPIIALTLRHDRLDNFWFVLMHELGHIFKHIYRGFNLDFFDEEEVAHDADPLEKEADDFALQSLLPDEEWDLCISKFAQSEESVLADAKRLAISPAIIAGKIRKETSNYYLLSKLVGNGQVRKLFPGEYND